MKAEKQCCALLVQVQTAVAHHNLPTARFNMARNTTRRKNNTNQNANSQVCRLLVLLDIPGLTGECFSP